MLTWKTGFEIELLAPEGKSRKTIAREFAKQNKANVERIFYPQSEPSKAEGVEVFHNLVLGYRVFNKQNETLLTCVDDLTIRENLNHSKPSKKGWYRIISDDTRLLRLAMQHCDAAADQRDVLLPLAKLFGTQMDRSEKDMFKIVDTLNNPVAVASTLPGERERPCELISPPLTQDHEPYLTHLLQLASELNFTVPIEAAVHVHFDANKLHNTAAFCRLVEILFQHGPALRKLVGVNTNCTRLGNLPNSLIEMVRSSGFYSKPWKEAKAELSKLELSKYCDFNLLNIVNDIPEKNTFEVRILPGSMNATEILHQAILFQEILELCLKGSPDEQSDLPTLLSSLNFDESEQSYWRKRL
jgi:hypothetical protein